MIRIGINELNELAKKNLIPDNTEIDVRYLKILANGKTEFMDHIEPFVYKRKKFISITGNNNWEDFIKLANNQKKYSTIVYAEIWQNLMLFNIKDAILEIKIHNKTI